MATTTAKKLNLLRTAVALKVARVTLRTHLAKDGAPTKDAAGLYDVEACRAWLQRESSANTEGGELRTLRAKKLRMETDQMEIELGKERGELVKKSEIVPAIAAFNSTLTADLEQEFVIELPQKCRGKTPAEIQVMTGAAVERVLAKLKAGQWALGIRE